MQRIDDLIGKKILIAINNSKEAAYDVILHGVENGGLWIESETHERILGYSRKKIAKNRNRPISKPVFFIPFSQIVFLVSFSTELDEETL